MWNAYIFISWASPFHEIGHRSDTLAMEMSSPKVRGWFFISNFYRPIYFHFQHLFFFSGCEREMCLRSRNNMFLNNVNECRRINFFLSRLSTLVDFHRLSLFLSIAVPYTLADAHRFSLLAQHNFFPPLRSCSRVWRTKKIYKFFFFVPCRLTFGRSTSRSARK